MKFLPLVWAMLWRRKTRTALTFASIAVAFLLYGLLQAFTSIFHIGAKIAGTDYLQVGHRFGFFQTLPYAYRAQIETVSGVRSVSPLVVFPIKYGSGQDQNMPSLAIDPHVVMADARFVASPEAWKAFAETRTGLLAGRALAEKYGWKVGDHVTVQSLWMKRKDGTDSWEFDVIGVFDIDIEGVRAMRAMVRYDYIDESRRKPGEVNGYIVALADPARATQVARAIDGLFENSAHPTKSETEAENLRRQLESIGDIGLILTSILSAVFFTLVVVAGNTMMRAFRERIPELAVMKTLGFGDGTVATLVALESVMLCVSAGLAGLALAWLVIKPLARVLASFMPFLTLEPATLVAGAALALALGVVTAVIPAWQSARLTVTAGLARR